MYNLYSENKGVDQLGSYRGTAQLICAFVFAYTKNMFSHDAAQIRHLVPLDGCIVSLKDGFITLHRLNSKTLVQSPKQDKELLEMACTMTNCFETTVLIHVSCMVC